MGKNAKRFGAKSIGDTFHKVAEARRHDGLLTAADGTHITEDGINIYAPKGYSGTTEFAAGDYVKAGGQRLRFRQLPAIANTRDVRHRATKPNSVCVGLTKFL